MSMDADYRESGERKNGLFAGSYSLVEKLSAGVGVQVLGLVLAFTGFDRAASEQPESAVTGIYVTAALIPALLMKIAPLAPSKARVLPNPGASASLPGASRWPTTCFDVWSSAAV